MKRIALLIGLLPCIATFAQKTVTTYYDYERKHAHEVYGTDNYGTKNGTYTEYSEYGGILVQGKYKNNTKIGRWIVNDEKGKLELEETFDNDGKDNGTIKRYVNGYLYAIENYKHGDRYGQWKTWYLGNGWHSEDATASDGIYLNNEGKTQLHLEEYYKPCPQRYEPGVGMLNWGLDSVRKEYGLDGFLISEVTYKLGIKSGKAIYYFNGSSKIMKECNYDNDNMNGEEKEYNKNGILTAQVNYLNGEKDGDFVIFDNEGSGEILTKGKLSKGKQMGDWKMALDTNWDETFNKSTEAFYKLESVSDDGSIKSSIYYITGEKGGEESFDTSGNLISRVIYYKDAKLKEKRAKNPATGGYDDVKYKEDGTVYH